ncbi:hypothetical protein RRX38_20490 [Pseudomonas sp. DTU_2021_1001937_2_SI_NGA_ILE_001]|uniref:hypothetical protein n=1 Tax=Pseudomonas sp. DTU_2021_1001937_2_SI_NGA_ILE_001 TaxID=3077589 RepID=UPI0028FC2B16|nr:hypothetical protein [Pseudomonas sp. DTU_2021_1001937_2_SI_NGA_ILE_001]WNW13433.1 hypothetical protein RRX38_20490 [Pseudomonas sp. DTU_2021_1001937_2_SI_NGA_ILE_001]
MATHLFILGDADQVRHGIDRLMLQGRLVELRELSEALTQGIHQLLDALETRMGAEVLMGGGDDLLVRVPQQAFSRSVMLELAKNFQCHTGCSISFGVGARLSIAYINLRRAKAERLVVCCQGLRI